MNSTKCPQCNNAPSEEKFLALIDPKKTRSFLAAMAGAATARTSEQAATAARARSQKENQVSEPNLSMAGFPTLRFRLAKTMAHIPHWYVVS
jgi:protein-disulfide isomerase-like protein with CxxC motif